MLTETEWNAVLTSLKVATASVALGLPFAIGLGYFLARWRSPGKWIVETVVNLPLVLPPVATGVLLLLLMGRNGPLGRLLDELLGWRVVFTWYGAVAAGAIVSFPLMVRTIRVSFRSVDTRLEEAARSLGRSRLSTFYRVSLPLALRGIVAGSFLGFARTLGEFGATIMVAGNIPGQTQTIPPPSIPCSRVRAGWAGAPACYWCRSCWPASRWRPAKSWNGDENAMSYLDFRASHRFPTGFRLHAEFETDQLVTALCGPSGSGKTTILEMIAGLKQPQRGRIEVGRKVVLDRQRRIMVPPERRRIGFVFQDRRLFPHLTVGGNLQFGQGPKDTPRNGIRFDRLVEVLDLGHLLKRYPRNLSGGEQQRVALGRALLIHPEFLLLDEPTAALDEPLRDRILDYIARVIGEWRIPTLIVSHVGRPSSGWPAEPSC